jgi:hypothetical protein
LCRERIENVHYISENSAEVILVGATLCVRPLGLPLRHEGRTHEFDPTLITLAVNIHKISSAEFSEHLDFAKKVFLNPHDQ